MKNAQYRLGLALGYSILAAPLHAALVPVTTDSAGPVQISYQLTNQKMVNSNRFLTNETVKLNVKISINPQDVGQKGQLYIVAKYNNAWYCLTANNTWKAWNGQVNSLVSAKTKILGKQEVIEVLKQTLPSGEFVVFSGYKTENGNLFYSATPAAFAVFNKQSAALHRIVNKSVLTALFKSGSVGGVTNMPVYSPMPTVLDVATTNMPGTGAISQTNLQEQGVDEGDRIKVAGDRLFTLENCGKELTQRCIAAYQMLETPASSTALGKLTLSNPAHYQDALYLTTPKGPSVQKQLVYIGSSMSGSIYERWFMPYFWGDNETQIQFIDINNPAQMQLKSSITVNAALLSSRVVDNVLYLVTRKNPYFYVEPAPVPIVLGPSATPVSPALADDSVQLPTTKPIATPPAAKDINDLLPTIKFDSGSATPLVKATDCYIPAQSSDKLFDNTLITVTAIPLHAPSQHYSVCVAGQVDTFYVSTAALYLATSRYPYQLAGNEITYDGERTTEIHKFSLSNAALNYGGSGTVSGHLGWDADKQPFRMGEYQGILKVATSLGDTWNNSSRSRVTVLQEDTQLKQLKTLALLDNLGKPGERLYAARFVQNRGYLVTFKTTDPLYVLDFKDPTKPDIVGELHINGYSDYLHPIGDNYLLGIGKDAIPDKEAERGAWYQGVKLSLFDVSSKANLKEVDSLIIGKRGTESAALWDHHALAWLASSATQSTLALPIELHNNYLPAEELKYYAKDYYTMPSAYYDWTHTGLYTFNINTAAKPAITLNKRLIADVSDPSNRYPNGRSTYNDRAVIQGNSVHYIHDDRVLSTELAK